MKYRTLGKTGLKVSEIGIGTWQLVGDEGAWTKADLEESKNSLYKFTDLGGNFIDTASSYGTYPGVPEDVHPSEKFIGEFLKESGLRDKVVIASKVHPKNMTWPAYKNSLVSNVFPKDHIEKIVDDSLKNLQVETIDVMQFHVWQDAWASEVEWKETITKITKEGKVKFWGISINDYQPSNCLKTIDTGLISTIQLIFNLFHQKPAVKLFPYAKENNIGLIARVPMDEGGLTGKYTVDTEFPEGDFRRDYFTKDRLKELVTRVSEIEKISSAEAQSILETNIRFILSFPEISTMIPGMRKTKFVESNLSFSDGRLLTKELLAELKKHSWERNFYPQTWHDPALNDSGGLEP